MENGEGREMKGIVDNVGFIFSDANSFAKTGQ